MPPVPAPFRVINRSPTASDSTVTPCSRFFFARFRNNSRDSMGRRHHFALSRCRQYRCCISAFWSAREGHLKKTAIMKDGAPCRPLPGIIVPVTWLALLGIRLDCHGVFSSYWLHLATSVCRTLQDAHRYDLPLPDELYLCKCLGEMLVHSKGSSSAWQGSTTYHAVYL